MDLSKVRSAAAEANDVLLGSPAQPDTYGVARMARLGADLSTQSDQLQALPSPVATPCTDTARTPHLGHSQSTPAPRTQAEHSAVLRATVSQSRSHYGLRCVPVAKVHTPVQALVELAQNGPVHYIVSQNVDSLHRRSGVPPDKLAEVHGNCFMERCPSCNTYYLRDFEMPSVGFQNTGRSCTRGRCRRAPPFSNCVRGARLPAVILRVCTAVLGGIGRAAAARTRHQTV